MIRHLTFRVAAGRSGPFAAGREQGALDRARLGLLVGRAYGLTLTIDLAGIRAMTLLYAEEFLGRCYTDLAAGDLPAEGMRLVGMNHETRYTAHVCLERRRDAALDGDRDELLGYVPALTETYAAARSLERFRAGELAESLGIGVSAANNRLARLVRAGALTRSRLNPARGGKEFEYRTLPLHGHPQGPDGQGDAVS